MANSAPQAAHSTAKFLPRMSLGLYQTLVGAVERAADLVTLSPCCREIIITPDCHTCDGRGETPPETPTGDAPRCECCAGSGKQSVKRCFCCDGVCP